MPDVVGLGADKRDFAKLAVHPAARCHGVGARARSCFLCVRILLVLLLLMLLALLQSPEKVGRPFVTARHAPALSPPACTHIIWCRKRSHIMSEASLSIASPCHINRHHHD